MSVEVNMSEKHIPDEKQLSRRSLGKVAVGVLGATQLGWSPLGFAGEPKASKTDSSKTSTMKLGCQCIANATDDDLLFYRQIGVDVVHVSGRQPDYKTVEGILAIKKRFADAGLVVDSVKSDGLDSIIADIVLNRPGRDKAIEGYKDLIRLQAAVGFPYIAQMFNATGAISSGLAVTRASKTRDCDLSSPSLTGVYAKGLKGAADEPLFGRVYTKDEIWQNFTYFMKEVVPVAEKEGVKIGFHPDDPPTPSQFGVAHILANFEDYKKALKIANSPNVGVCLCLGSWAEGGTSMGIDAAGAARYFGAQKKIFEIHFRNVSGTMPHFNETYVDNGYYDLFKVMKALVEVNYNGIVQLDHDVPMVGGLRSYEAFSIGYMRAMLQCAQGDVRKA